MISTLSVSPSPLPLSSIMLGSNLPISKGSLVLKERNDSHIVPLSTITTSTPRIRPKKLLQINNNSSNVFEGLCLARTGLFSGQAGMIMQRLEAVGERVREMEMEKFFSRTKGEELSEEERVVVENMSRELVCKFLEKPMQYLRSGYGEMMENKLEKMNFVVGILEDSYFNKEKRSIHVF